MLRKHRVIVGLLIAAALIGAALYRAPAPSIRAVQPPGIYPIDHFIDGDTLAVTMDSHVESVRFIGVDTPETVKPNTAQQCYGREASEFVKHIIGTQPVRLVADPLGDNRDRYNRLVRYIYLMDGTSLDQLLVEQGYGFAYQLYPFSQWKDYSAAEDRARAAKRGLWAECQPTFDGGHWQSNDL